MTIKREYVTLNGRQYTVTFHGNGMPPHISTTWEVIDPKTVWNVRPNYFTRYSSIMRSGRLGRKVLRLAEQQAAKAHG